MEIFNLFLIAHIICGSLSLILGLIVLVLRKGDKRHRKIGSMFYYSMLLASIISIPMAVMHPNYFLFMIAVFTLYMLLSGKRYLLKKGPVKPHTFDIFLSILMAVAGMGFIVFGLYHLLNGKTFGTVFLVFGGLACLFVYQDYINFNGKSKIKNFWLTTHFQRMTGSYIASSTAFLVVNNQILPSVLAWLLPTVLLTPLIIKWSREKGKEFKKISETE